MFISPSIRHCIVMLALCAGANADAFTIAPTAIMLEGLAPEPAKIRITASSSAPLALDFSFVERQAEGAQERLFSSNADIAVQPPQLYLAAGEATDVVVRWSGKVQDRSRSFFLVADELPIAFAEGKAQKNLRFLARVHLPVHIANGGKPDLQVTISTVDGEAKIEILNRGSRYARFSGLTLRATRTSGASDNTTKIISGVELARAARIDAILPGRGVMLRAEDLGLEARDMNLELIAQE